MDIDKAAGIADNRKSRDQLSLFADQLPEITPEQVKAALDRHASIFKWCRHELQARGDTYRARVAEMVTTDELVMLDAQRANIPLAAEYHADFWHRQWNAYRCRNALKN